MAGPCPMVGEEGLNAVDSEEAILVLARLEEASPALAAALPVVEVSRAQHRAQHPESEWAEVVSPLTQTARPLEEVACTVVVTEEADWPVAQVLTRTAAKVVSSALFFSLRR